MALTKHQKYALYLFLNSPSELRVALTKPNTPQNDADMGARLQSVLGPQLGIAWESLTPAEKTSLASLYNKLDSPTDIAIALVEEYTDTGCPNGGVQGEIFGALG